MSDFTELACDPDAGLDSLALAVAASFREVDADATLARLDDLATDVRSLVASREGDPAARARACAEVLGGRHGFAGDADDYEHPDNSMLDLVVTRRRGLPILLSVVYVEVARRADIPLAGVGLPGHFIVGHFGADPPLLLDPFGGGSQLRATFPKEQVRPWSAHEIAMRMLNNLVGCFQRRGDFPAAIQAAEMRLALPSDGVLHQVLAAELRALHSRFN